MLLRIKGLHLIKKKEFLFLEMYWCLLISIAVLWLPGLKELSFIIKLFQEAGISLKAGKY